jgi:hypothetical protein
MQDATTVVNAVVSQGSVMDATAVATIGALVTTLSQIVKRSIPGNADAYGPLIAAVLSAGGVALWVYSAPTFPPERTDVWAIGAGWVAVFAASVGIYESVKMATHIASRPPNREDVAEPHEHLDQPPHVPTPNRADDAPDAIYAAAYGDGRRSTLNPPARRPRRTVPAPPEAVLTAPVVSTPQPRWRAGQMPEMTS